MDSSRQPAKAHLVWMSLLVLVPLILALADHVRDLYCDIAVIRAVVLRSEMSRLRSQTIRQAGRLESLLELHLPGGQSADEFDWSRLAPEPWLASQWSSLSAVTGRDSYVAVVDPLGKIVLHTSPSVVGKRLTSEWDDEKEPDAGSDVVRIPSGPLVGEKAALDVNVPLDIGGRHIGQMHAGIDAATFDARVAAEQRHYLWQRSWIEGLVLAANLAAVVGLILLARDFGRLRRQLGQAVHDQARLLAQLGIGLAHELRNPLHALRINVHTLRRALSRIALGDRQVGEMIQESSDEIDRMDTLVRDFVQYTVPQTGDIADVDLEEEVRATLHLLGDELRRKHIELTTRFSQQPLTVRIAPDRMRHAALNLLTFAQRSAGSEGSIEVSMTQLNGSAELVVTDSGPALSAADQARLFEPFQSTAHSDGDLGLALIRRFITEAGGSIVRDHASGHNCFRLRLPLVQRTTLGAQS